MNRAAADLVWSKLTQMLFSSPLKSVSIELCCVSMPFVLLLKSFLFLSGFVVACILFVVLLVSNICLCHLCPQRQRQKLSSSLYFDPANSILKGIYFFKDICWILMARSYSCNSSAYHFLLSIICK